jgi:hypothetical protein
MVHPVFGARARLSGQRKLPLSGLLIKGGRPLDRIFGSRNEIVLFKSTRLGWRLHD